MAPLGLALFLIAGMAFLWRLGGSIKKEYRRFGAPLLLLSYAVLTGTAWWMAIAAAGALLGVTFLPITLIGSEEKDNLAWIALLGQFHGFTLLPLALWQDWLVGLVVSFVVGFNYTSLIYLSVFTQYKFKWSWFEVAFGTLYGLSAVFLLR